MIMQHLRRVPFVWTAVVIAVPTMAFAADPNQAVQDLPIPYDSIRELSPVMQVDQMGRETPYETQREYLLGSEIVMHESIFTPDPSGPGPHTWSGIKNGKPTWGAIDRNGNGKPDTIMQFCDQEGCITRQDSNGDWFFDVYSFTDHANLPQKLALSRNMDEHFDHWSYTISEEVLFDVYDSDRDQKPDHWSLAADDVSIYTEPSSAIARGVIETVTLRDGRQTDVLGVSTKNAGPTEYLKPDNATYAKFREGFLKFMNDENPFVRSPKEIWDERLAKVLAESKS